MSENRETVDEITAKMGNYTNECNDGYRTEYHVVIEDMKSFAERINEARKREAGNCAKMREALKEIAKLMDRILVSTELDDEIHRIALEAQNMADGVLLLSPRNCQLPPR